MIAVVKHKHGQHAVKQEPLVSNTRARQASADTACREAHLPGHNDLTLTSRSYARSFLHVESSDQLAELAAISHALQLVTDFVDSQLRKVDI